MRRIVMSSSVKLAIVAGPVHAVAGLVTGNWPQLAAGGIIAYLSYRLGDLGVTARRLLEQTQTVIHYNGVLIAHGTAQAELINDLLAENHRLMVAAGHIKQGEEHGANEAGAAV